jgi:hypothetical protein
MEQEQTLNPKESLALITEVINKTKENINQHSFIFLLWGWLLVVATVSRYLLTAFTDFKYFFLPYPILSALGILVTILFYLQKSMVNTETYLSYFIKRLWMVLLLGFISVVFISVYQNIQPAPYIMIVGGIGTLVTGVVLKFKPLQIGGILFLLLAIISSLIANEYKDLVHGIAIILGYLIPGYLLKSAKA